MDFTENPIFTRLDRDHAEMKRGSLIERRVNEILAHAWDNAHDEDSMTGSLICLLSYENDKRVRAWFAKRGFIA